MRAYARVLAVADGRGTTRLDTLRSEPPLVLRRTGPDTVHLVGAAAGPLDGDDLRLDVEVRAGARLCLRTVAASVALPGRHGTPSRFTVTAQVSSGASLYWLPEPLITAAGSHHVMTAAVELADGATLLWRDELICGRYGEDPGDATVGLSVRLAGRALLHQSLSVGPGSESWSGPAVLGGAKATGSLLRVAPNRPVQPPAVLGPTAVLVPLDPTGSLVTATADDAYTLRRYLDLG
jgi:urease accessory protein